MEASEKKWDEQGVREGRFEAFREIIRALRSEGGCPWDRRQTFESLKPCMINELTESVAGINLYQETGDAENLCEELGDLLLQVVLLAQIAEEDGLFAIEDVVRGVSRKMLRRHPHVFGRLTAEESGLGEVWDVKTLYAAAEQGDAPDDVPEKQAVGSRETENIAGAGMPAQQVCGSRGTENAAEANVSDGAPGGASLSAQEIPGLWDAVKRAEKQRKRPGQEQQEKAAFADAAREVIAHEERELCRSRTNTQKGNPLP